MNAYGFKTGTVFLITLLLAVSLVVTVSAVEEKGVVRTDASKVQLELINELHGKDITVLEYMEKVHPEHIVGISESAKKNMAAQKMKWWGKELSPGEKSILTPTVSVIATGYTADWRTIHFEGTCTASGMANPPSYIYVEAFLIDTETGNSVDSTSASSRDGVWSITAPKNKLYPDNGEYKVYAWGYIPYPYYADDDDETNEFDFP